MPNWCNNSVSFDHDDPEMMRRLNDAAGRALCPDNCAVCSGREPRSAEHVVGFFEEFVPFPAEHGWDYGWCNLHWGVKWDARDIDGEDSQYHFNTPWGPPIEFYDAMTDLGFKVKAFYEELGDRLVGVYEHGENNRYRLEFRSDYDALPREVQEYIGDSMSWLFGSDDEEEDSIKTIKIASKPKREEIIIQLAAAPDTEPVCPICQLAKCDETPDYTKIIVTACGHAFHRKCLKDWVAENTTCPTCRTDIINFHDEGAAFGSQETNAASTPPPADA